MNYPPSILSYVSPRRAAPAHSRASNINLALGIALMLGVSFAALQVSPILAGVCYAVGFILLTWSRPTLALVLIFATAPIQTDISGGGDLKFSIAEINLALSLPIWLVAARRPKGQARAIALGVSLAVYFAVSLFSSLLHWRGSTALVSIVQMWLYMVGAVGVFAALVKRPEQYIGCLITLLGVCTVFAVAAIFQRDRGGYVLGMHKNGVGSSLAVAVIIGVELCFSHGLLKAKKLVIAATIIAFVGLILSLSRGSWVAAAVGVAIILLMRGRFRLMARVLLATVPVLAIAWMLIPADKRDYVLNFDQSNLNISARYASIEIARGHFISSPLLGVGVGLRKEFDATNIFWVTLAETGILGAAAFVCIQGSLVLMMVQMRRRIGPTDPRFTFAVLGGALALGQFAHGMVDHYWSRGALMAAWAAVGMLLRVYREAAGTRGAKGRRLFP